MGELDDLKQFAYLVLCMFSGFGLVVFASQAIEGDTSFETFCGISASMLLMWAFYKLAMRVQN